MLEQTNETMQHDASRVAMRRNPCDCYVLNCACSDRVRSTRLVDYASYSAGEAGRAMLTGPLTVYHSIRIRRKRGA